jgi:DNA-binding NarL/FixJ family response regulator
MTRTALLLTALLACTAHRTVIVDDERLARDKLRRLLAAAPDVAVIAECGSGTEAIAAIRAGAPDLILLDGFAVVRALGNRYAALVFVSAHDHAVRAFEVAAFHGEYEVLVKSGGGSALPRAPPERGWWKVVNKHPCTADLLKPK